MAPLRQRSTRAFLSPSAVGTARLVAGLLLTGSARSVHALVPNAVVSSNPTASFGGPPRPLARSCVRRRGAWAMGLSAPGESEAGDIESSELYADMRRRLEDLRRSGDDSGEDQQEDWTEDGVDRRRTQRGGGGGGGGGAGVGEKGAASGTKAYSGQEMKKAYYEAFWRARNLHKEAKFDVGSQGGDNGSAPPSKDPAAPPATPPTAQLASRSTMLTPMGLDLVLMSRAASAAASETAALSTSDVQGLTQMYYLEEEAEERAHEAIAAAAAPLAAAAASVAVGGSGGNNAGASFARGNVGKGVEKKEAELLAGAGVLAFGGGRPSSLEHAEPQGMTQMFFLDKEEEAAVAAAMPRSAVESSFLRERLGVSGEVVQGLRQVELDHARLAMLAVLLTGAIGAGAGVPSDASFMDTQHGFAALADVARTPWLDPCVAGLILTVKALSEGDWRLGKGALAAWADQALRAVSDSGAKVLRLSSGDEMRRLAVEMEVKHGRLALGAVVCAMAQQGLATVGA